MNIRTTTIVSVIGLICAIGCSSAGSAGQDEPLGAGEPARVEEGPSSVSGTDMPSQNPTQEIAASAESTSETGVARWKLYDDLEAGNIHIYGVGTSGELLTALRIGGDALTTGTDEGALMESLYPASGRLELDAEGNVIVDQLSEDSIQAFGAMARDFQSTLDTSGPELQGSRFACIRAGVLVGASCGLAVIGCVTSAPTIVIGLAVCGVGALGCGAAMQDWACACHDVCVN
jgi:hypothetical protein